MMAGLVSSGVLLLVLLTGASYSYPAKGFSEPASHGGSSYDANPASAGSNWGVPSSGAGSNPAPSQPQPSAQRQPAATYSSNSYAAPVDSGYAGSPAAASTDFSAFQPSSGQDLSWAVDPPRPYSVEETGPSASRFVGSPAPDSLGYVSPPVLPPQFQAGELSAFSATYEHGNSESESEELNSEQPPPPPPGVAGFSGQAPSREIQPPGLYRRWLEFPYNYRFLTGQYPPGTVTHASQSFEQGRDHWQDSHYIRYYYPDIASAPGQTSSAAFEAPQPAKQPSQPAQQRIGSTGWSGAMTGPNQPYRTTGLQGPSFQAGVHKPPRRLPAGGYGQGKRGH